MRVVIALSCVCVLAIACVLFVSRRGTATLGVAEGGSATGELVADASGKGAGPSSSGGRSAGSAAEADAADDESDADADEQEKTPEEDEEDVEERLVNTFDDLTDQWMEPAKTSVSMADIDKFVATFKKVPKARQDECVHRALNLIPDENVMLLAGLLLDKTLDKETIETVFNDILNRDEDVKKPILQRLFKDKSHPCWADVAWILDVTGELPAPQKAAP